MARERVTIGPLPGWIAPCDYDASFKPKVHGPVTHLLVEQQVHAELGQTFVRTALRLETIQAVQHYSQWRLEFEPQTQAVVVHSIRIRRGSIETEHASLGRMRFLQREAGLEGCVIDGWITLLLLLENVCPGDVLEWSYTLASRPRLLPEHVGFFFTLPAGLQVGKYNFAARHAESRDLRWKSSAPELAPAITRERTEVICSWRGENFASPEPEECSPEWQIDHPWIQISDCPDWQTVARAVAQAWKEEGAGDGLTKLVEEIRSGPDLLTRIHRAIELVQDGFRYLSVNLEFGGQIPATTETVIRRRYGDCKDLAFLLVQLLRALGISARPVLVNVKWRQSITLLLPSPGVFDHVVVEFQVESERRWVDVTLKRQGGGALRRCVPDYGLGLPIDADTLTLVPVPAASVPSGAFEVKESFILDTAGNPSWFAIVARATGIHADSLRLEFENEGIESITKKRLQYCANRFYRAARVGQLQYRDDREHNEVAVAEAFEIDGFLKQDAAPDTCLFSIQSEVTAGMLTCPPTVPRRGPYALPFPCNRVHTVEVDFTGMDALSVPVYQAGNEFFSFSRRSKSLQKFFRVTFSFNTRADSVPANRLAEHRRQVEPVWLASAIQLRLPVGYMRMRKPGDFGSLPEPSRTASGGTSVARSAPPVVPAAAEPAREARPGATIEAPAAPARAVEPAGKRVFLDPSTAVEPARRSRSTRSSASSSHPFFARGRMNRRCLFSFYVLLGAVAAFVAAIVVGNIPGGEAIAGLMLLLVIPTVGTSLVLAVLGLTQCARHPERYRRGKAVATATLVFDGLLGLIVVLGLATGIRGMLAANRGQRQSFDRSQELLKFTTLNFVFHSPGQPWIQTDARNFGRGPVLAFVRPDGMNFTVVASRLEPGHPDARRRIVELAKANIRSAMTSYRLISEGDVTHNRLVGWQMETQAFFQGREFFLVDWLLATNGFGYHLTMWGPPELRAQVMEEASHLFAKFELTTTRD